MLGKFLADNTKAVISGNSVDLYTIINDYVTRRQRATYREILDHIYVKIGNNYKSKSVDDYVLKLINIQVNNGNFIVKDGYYVFKKLLKEG